MKLSLDNLKEDKQPNDVLEIKKRMNQETNELKDQLHRTEQQLRKTLDQGYVIKDKFQ
jgi:ribulose bisphosphate carboxylase small subunit